MWQRSIEFGREIHSTHKYKDIWTQQQQQQKNEAGDRQQQQVKKQTSTTTRISFQVWRRAPSDYLLFEHQASLNSLACSLSVAVH